MLSFWCRSDRIVRAPSVRPRIISKRKGSQPRVLVSCVIIRNACVRRASSGSPSNWAGLSGHRMNRSFKLVFCAMSWPCSSMRARPRYWKTLRTMRPDKTWI